MNDKPRAWKLLNLIEHQVMQEELDRLKQENAEQAKKIKGIEDRYNNACDECGETIVWEDDISFECPVCRARKEIAEQAAEIERLRKGKMSWCAFCGVGMNLDGRDAVAAARKHVAECQKHPAREIEKRAERAKSKLDQARDDLAEEQDVRAYWTDRFNRLKEAVRRSVSKDVGIAIVRAYGDVWREREAKQPDPPEPPEPVAGPEGAG